MKTRKRKSESESRKAKGNAEKVCAGPFLDQREVAKRLGLQPRTVGNWAREQKLPAYRFGRLLRFKWDEVEQALAANFRCVPVAAPLAIGAPRKT